MLRPHTRVTLANRPHRTPSRVVAVLLAVLAVALWPAVFAAPAFAGHASLGQLLFYPCTTCHKGNGLPQQPLPNGFKGHGIVLESHDKLGQGSAACLVCHDDPARDPGKLKLMDGSLVDVTSNDVSLVCYRCHEDKYKEFEAGTHGKHQPSCVAAGCHDPHTPSYVYAAPLRPFVGTGFTVRAVSDRKAFTPRASAPVPPPVQTPSWLVLGATIGAVVSAGLAGSLILGRSER